MDTLRNGQPFGYGEEKDAGDIGRRNVGPAEPVTYRSALYFTSMLVSEEHKGCSTFSSALFLKYKCHPIL